MTKIEAQQLISQMHQLRAQVSPRREVAPSDDFQHAMVTALQKTNQTHLEANHLAKQFELGENVDLSDVMIAQQKSNIAFQTVLQVRNRLVQAYQDIMNMPI